MILGIENKDKKEVVKLEKRCKKLMGALRKDFPPLKDIKIHLKIKKLRKGSMRTNKVFYLYYLIIVDPNKYFGASDNEIIGALAHELIHLEQFKKMGFLEYIISFIKYKISKRFVRRVEIGTDKETVRRGYAKELYANRKFRLKKIFHKDRKLIPNYLFSERIKSYAKKIGKW